jgi:hypothetical protein
MMLDSSIPLMAKGIDGLKMLEDGSQIAQLWQNQKTDGELNRLYKETNGDLNKMLEIGKTSPLARFVMPQLQAQQAAQQKAALDQQKIEAEIGKTQSEAFKNNQQGGGYGLDNAGKLMASANQALTVAARTGDPRAARLALSNHLKAGTITPELYNQFDEQIKLIGNNPEELKKYAQSIVLAQSKDPDKYMFTTADNVLDNQTSADNNIRTNQTSENNSIRTAETSRYSTDVNAQAAANKLSFEQAKNEQEQKKGTVLQWGDTMYMVYPDNSVKEVASPTGQPIVKSTTSKGGMSATAQKELFEVSDSISAAKNGIANLRDALKYSAKAYDGVGASQRAAVVGNFKDSEEATATTMLKNILQGNALEILKATFGGSPTEGERAILMELQGSVNLPRADREAIYNRAIQMAERRLQSNEQKAEAIRNGGFFKPSTQQIPASIAKPSGNTQSLSGAQSKGFQSLIEKHTK